MCLIKNNFIRCINKDVVKNKNDELLIFFNKKKKVPQRFWNSPRSIE